MPEYKDFDGLNPLPDFKSETKWGTYQSDAGELAVVPTLEFESHVPFSIACGCGVRVSWENGVPIFVHQEVRN